MLSQLKAVTHSAGQIEAGNLDLTVDVQSNDEIGQLASAFNSMAAKLREFKKKDETKLIRTQQTTQLAIDSLPEPVMVVNLEGRIELANTAASRLVSIKPDESLTDASPAWLRELYSQTMTGQMPPADGYKSAIQVFDGDAEVFLLPRAVAMKDTIGQTIGVTIILVNVTQLRHADELKSDLVSTVSHELRTPLTGLQMSVHMLEDPLLGELNARQRELVGTAVGCTDRLFRVIDHLLSISRIESGKVPLQVQPTSPAELISQACALQQKAFDERQIVLAVTIAPDLPAILADVASVQYVFANLLSNALKYTPPYGQVTVSAQATGREVRFVVADTGPGIPEEFQDSVFEKFFRIPTASGPSGAGLGLSIAREIVLAHGGTIRVQTSSVGGSEFIFTLPMA